MAILRKEFQFPAANGLGDIYACMWQEEGREQFKAVVQIAHGMAEHILRYEAFAACLARHGFLVCGNDHTGHGRSVLEEANRGYFGEKDNSWMYLEADMRYLMTFMQERFADLPYVILGHSMGSFLARQFAFDYGNALTGAVFIGSSAGTPLLDVVLAASKAGILQHGAKTPGAPINQIAFANFNKRFERRTEFDWLNSIPEEVDHYIADPLCGYLFTYAGYRDLFQLTKRVNKREWAEGMRKDLPMLLLAGDQDPVGDYGKGVVKVYKRLKAAGCEQVEIKLYPGDRHEILNEKDKLTVYHDVVRWLEGIL